MLGESKAANKPSPVMGGYRGARLPAVLVLFALIPLAATIQVAQNVSYASIPLNGQPGVQNQYPENATAGRKIVITTTVTSGPCAVECVTDYTEVIVNILLPNTSVILSTAPASPAVNTVTAPATGGPWSLTVQVLWINYPTDGTLATFQTTITIQIIGPLPISKTTISTVSSSKFTSSRLAASSTESYSAATSVTVSSSAVIPYSTAISSSFTSTSVAPSTLPFNPFSNILPYIQQNSTGALILGVLVILLLVGVFVLKRRRG